MAVNVWLKIKHSNEFWEVIKGFIPIFTNICKNKSAYLKNMIGDPIWADHKNYGHIQ